MMRRYLTLLCLLAGAAAVGLRIFVFGLSSIPQNGMYLNLPAGTYVITLKRPYRTAADVRRGEVIAFLQEIEGVRYKFIWRVVGLPGERVGTQNGRLFINGKPAEYRLLDHAGTDKTVIEEVTPGARYKVAFGPSPKPAQDASLAVPLASFFVLGDNRNNAADSRVYGVVPFSAITGKAVASW